MDDNTFDDLLRKKLGSYEGPVFDPTALELMRARLVNLKTAPWYAQTASRLFVVSSLILFTLINAYILKTIVGESAPLLSFPVADFQKEAIIDSLTRAIVTTQHELRQTRIQNSRESQTQTTIANAQDMILINPGRDTVAGSAFLINLGLASNIPDDVRQTLSGIGLLSIKDGQVYVSIHPSGTTPAQDVEFINTMRPPPLTMRNPDPPRFILLGNIETREQTAVAKNKMAPVSLATQKALEKHYFKGVGIEVAPHVDAVLGIFANGSGEISPRIGLSADWILSPSLSMETGFDYLTTERHVSATSIDQDPNGYQQFGAPKSVKLSYTLGSMPIAIKYRQWITSKNQFVLKIGMTPYTSFRKEYQYKYQYNNAGPDHDPATITTLDRHDAFRYVNTTIAGALGITSMKARNKSKFETSLFYERNLGRAGETTSMQLVGLRAAYWLKVK